MSSSEDEDFSHLADCVYSVTSVKEDAKPKSQRVVEDRCPQSDYKNLNVSAAFRKHVSKHLETLMESKANFVDVKEKKKKKKKKVGECGVRLLSCSEKALTVDESEVRTFCPGRKPKRRNELGDDEILKRAKLVAVSGDYVLSKKEIIAWAPETRGKVESVKC